jgi:hypothetical protein
MDITHNDATINAYNRDSDATANRLLSGNHLEGRLWPLMNQKQQELLALLQRGGVCEVILCIVNCYIVHCLNVRDSQ